MGLQPWLVWQVSCEAVGTEQDCLYLTYIGYTYLYKYQCDLRNGARSGAIVICIYMHVHSMGY
jgi:hypothetical protein